MEVTPLSAPGLILSLVFITQLFVFFLFFEEIPLSQRRLPLGGSSSAFAVESAELTPYVAAGGDRNEQIQGVNAGTSHPNRYISTTGVNI